MRKLPRLPPLPAPGASAKLAVVPKKFRKLLPGLLIIVALAVVALMAFTTARPPPRPPLPIPNGYDDFLAAGRALAGDLNDSSTLDHDALRELIASNAEPLRLVRLGLTRKCALPDDPLSANFGVIARELIAIKKLANLLQAEGHLAEMENRSGDAARSYVDTIALGNQMSGGGVVITRLVGIACESIGTIPLIKLLPRLNCEQTRPLISELEKTDKGRVNWNEIAQNEGRFARAQISQYRNPIQLAKDWLEARTSTKSAELIHKRAGARLRLLTAELALRCYRFERGRPPTSLGELVPNYLSRLPVDPFSGQPLVYRSQGMNWLLYSVGADGVDDGGTPAGRSPESKGDLFFDSRW